MSMRNTNDPQHWRDRAAQMRALALKMGDTVTAIGYRFTDGSNVLRLQKI